MTHQTKSPNARQPSASSLPRRGGPNPVSPGLTLSATEARSGERVGLIWVLIISTGLAVLAMTAFWVIALWHSGATRPSKTAPAVSRAASAGPSAKSPIANP
jgi:hypothetical protein